MTFPTTAWRQWHSLHDALLEGFDPKPALDRYAGKTIDESPYRSAVLDSPFYRKNVRDFSGKPRELMAQLYPIQIGYQKRARAASR